MVDCWADKLGNCSTKQSKEHLISRGVLQNNSDKNNKIVTWGFDWCNPTKTNEIGVASFASGILCTYHNNLLSVVDACAVYAYNTLQKLVALVKNPESIPKNQVMQYKIDGCLLERWFLKTAINMLYTDIGLDKPPLDFLNLVFGLKGFSENAGLRLADSLRIPGSPEEDGIKFTYAMQENNTTFSTALFEFRGWKFALPLNGKPLSNNSLSNIDCVPLGYFPVDRFNREFLKSKLFYHLEHFYFNLGKNSTFEIEFDWNNSKPKETIEEFNAWYCSKKIRFYGNPIAIDAKGKQVSCELTMDKRNGLMKLVIPQDFLDKAEYPVHVRWGFYPTRRDVLKFYDKYKK